MIWIYTRFYPVNLDEAVGEAADDFETFNHFFTRRLKPGARPLPDAADVLVCPADGTVSQAGPIAEGQLVQAKGQRYSVADLLGDAGLAARYEGGAFVTIYLSPRDYHRVHVPCESELASATEIPGRLFSVNASSERRVAGLFARNERLVMHLRCRVRRLRPRHGGSPHRRRHRHALAKTASAEGRENQAARSPS